MALIVGAALAYNETIDPDVGLGARLGRRFWLGRPLFDPHPLRGIVAPAANVLSEDPCGPDPRGPTARQPGAADVSTPSKSRRKGFDPRPGQADRRRTVDDVVLIRPLRLGSFHASISFSDTINEAIARRDCRPADVVPTGSLTCCVYVPQ